jgi:fumagillin biosynthesis cytochrome P450 monooxygenase
MTHDPSVYKDPEVFNPSRYLGKHPKPDPRSYIFGFGRRVCPGRHLASNNVLLACALILATCKISKARSSDGKEIIPLVEFEGEVVT